MRSAQGLPELCDDCTLKYECIGSLGPECFEFSPARANVTPGRPVVETTAYFADKTSERGLSDALPIADVTPDSPKALRYAEIAGDSELKREIGMRLLGNVLECEGSQVADGFTHCPALNPLTIREAGL